MQGLFVPVIIAGGWVGGKTIMTCNKDTTDLDCLDCPYGYDDDEAVYCGGADEKSVQVLREDTR